MPDPNQGSMIVTEEASQKELATTEVSRPVAKQMVLGFLALVLLPALLQVMWQAPQGKVFEEFSTPLSDKRFFRREELETINFM